MLIALIGPNWVDSLEDRDGNNRTDYVRSEVEKALEAEGQQVIPALIEGASRPTEADLANLSTLQRLLKRQEVKLSASSNWDEEVERLIERLKQMGVAEATSSPQPSAPRAVPVAQESESEDEDEAEDKDKVKDEDEAKDKDEDEAVDEAEDEDEDEDDEDSVRPPRRRHYNELAGLLLEEAFGVVPFLGPGVNSCDRAEPWEAHISTYLPDADELARYLAQRSRTGGGGTKETALGLALASQSLWNTKGDGVLYGALKDALKEVQPARREPGPVHRFLATLPKKLRSMGVVDRCQLIVTANYDNALERAFDEAEQAYDLAVYLPSKRTFLHVPYNGEPKEVEDASNDDSFPIFLDSGRVKRTVIMKIHGAIDEIRGRVDPDGCVITEDDYISYMSKGAIESIVPIQLLGKLRKSRFLFLGHEMHDWSLRVFLFRVLGEGGLSHDPSWALQREASELDEELWRRLGSVKLFAVPLDEYVTKLGKSLERAASAPKPTS